MSKPLVAIVGRPNVGKSTFFNRAIGQRLAIVEDVPGTTRDRLYGDTEWNGLTFTLIDTGGLVLGEADDLTAQVRAQAEVAIAEADAIIFITDVLDGLVPADHDIAGVLRRTRKPVILAANKADNAERRAHALEFYELGLGEVYPVSSLHGTGVAEVLDAVVAALPKVAEEEMPEGVRIAIVGRPNVGKSMLLNRILGQERAIVSEIPGTTRDALDTPLTWKGQPVVLVDTAGIRKRGAIDRGVERYSVLRALKAINRADVVLLLIDAIEGITAQDAHIAGYILEDYKSLVLVVNKWDAVKKEAHTMEEFTTRIREQLRFMPWVPILYVSALTGLRVSEVMDTALRVREQRFQRIPTGELNELVADAIARHAPPSKAGKRLAFYYATQPEVDPPTIVFFVNDARLVHFSYQRYLENRIRERWGFEGTPLVLRFRGREKRKRR
ncbi:MAG: ribosome biogenesis GTPase Der [Chloroflexi bacterium]|nr:ribosome biogenesis GTPase Der [Chloroflexota bacterium]